MALRNVMYRQGDLLFIKREARQFPAGIKKNSRVVLGSTITGHEHKITEGEVYVNDNVNGRDPGNFYVVIPEGGAELVHPEHKSIPLEEGIYEVRRQREVNGYVQD